MRKRIQASDMGTLAYRFLEALGERPFPPAAADCAKAAFALYAQEWDCHGDHITEWEWPFRVAKEGGKFNGDEPWSVLFRHAVQLVQESKKQAA